MVVAPLVNRRCKLLRINNTKEACCHCVDEKPNKRVLEPREIKQSLERNREEADLSWAER